MVRGLLAACATFAALAFGQQAQAATWTFWFNGAGVSGGGVITAVPNGAGATDPDPLCGTAGHNPCQFDPAGADKITGIMGTFSDANIGIVNAHITGLVPINPANERDATFDPAVPASLSFIDYANENSEGGGLSYNNLFFPGGSPIDCAYPFSGTFLDVFGVAFTISGGDTVVLWGDGNYQFGPLTYGVGVTDGVNKLDYQFSGVNAAIPEPSVWAMLLVGFAGLGFARFRRRNATGAATVAA